MILPIIPPRYGKPFPPCGQRTRDNALSLSLSRGPIPAEGGAFNFCITDENDNAFVLQYINSTGGTDTISDGIVNSYQDPVDSIPGSSKEWGNWDGTIGSPGHVRNSYLKFIIDSPKKIKMKLKIREGKMTMSSEKSFGAFIRVLVDGAVEDLKYDYDAGYDSSYKDIYNKVTDYFLTS